MDGDSLVVLLGTQRRVIPVESVESVERVSGRHGHTVRGALIGGLAVGGVVGAGMLSNPQQCRGSGNYGQLCAVLLGATTLGGAAVGALIGTLIRHDDWVTAYVAPSGFDPAGPRVSVGFTVRF